MIELTDRQKAILKFIQTYIKVNKRSPAYKEISKEFKISIKAVFDHVGALEKKGEITRKTGSRVIILNKDAFLDWLEQEIKNAKNSKVYYILCGVKAKYLEIDD